MAKQIIVRTYTGSQSGAAEAFRKDAAQLAPQDYFPISQSWAAAHGNTDLFLWHGLLSVVYALRRLRKPAGTLAVNYEYRPNPQRGGSQVKA